MLGALSERYAAQFDPLATDALPRVSAMLRARAPCAAPRATVRGIAAGLTCAFAPPAQEAVLQFNSRSKVDAVRQKVETVKNTMSSNIDKARACVLPWSLSRALLTLRPQVLERGERLDDVAAKSETMRDQAAAFRNKGRQLRRQMWWQNVKWTLLLIIVVLLVAFAVFLAACRGFSCVK